MTRYFIGLGSNIAPNRNVGEMLNALLRFLHRIDVSRIIETCPVGIPDAPRFLNLAASFLSEKDEDTLKRKFNQIEATLGRDRQDGERKWQNRTADIDILFKLPARETSVKPTLIPPEPYVAPGVVELIHYLDLEVEKAVLTDMKPGVEVEVGGVAIGKSPVTLQATWDGKITVHEMQTVDRRIRNGRK
jgi:2-amino-4-hydroxy-6-hydroxymethyldihydropteridine diphosphokinase